MNTFTPKAVIGIRMPTGRKEYMMPGREYKVDGRRKGFFNPASRIVSKDLIARYVEEPVEVDLDETPNTEEEY